MNLLLSILAVFALIPGSLLFVAVVVWRILRRFLGFVKPTGFPAAIPGGMILDEASWHRLARAEYPVRYALFESLPNFLAGLWGRAKRSWRRLREAVRPPTVRESILADAFWALDAWCDSNPQQLSMGNHGVTDDDEEGPIGRYAARMAEISSLREWWTIRRPAQLAALDELDDEESRQIGLLSLSYDDEHNFSRLANLWRDLI